MQLAYVVFLVIHHLLLAFPQAGDASAQANMSSEQQLGWLGHPAEGGGAEIFEKVNNRH